MNKNILIAGGTGYIGRHLSEYLISKKYNVAILSRTNKINGLIKTFKCDYNNHFIDNDAIDFADIIINLSGSNIGEGYWTSKKKLDILESRIKSTKTIVDYINESDKNIKLIGASAVGFYGNTSQNKIFTENDNPGEDFLSMVCNKWESEYKMLNNINNLSIIRTGVVLGKDSKIIKQIALSQKLGFIAYVGKGTQIVPWIHISDLIRIYEFFILNFELFGTYNAVAPCITSNKDISESIAKKLNTTVLPFGIPGFLLKMILGEKSQLVLEGNAVSSEKLINVGFIYNVSNIEMLKESL